MSLLIAQAPPREANFGRAIEPVSPIYSPSANPAENLELIVSTVLGIITVVGGLFFIVYFFLGALKWLTAAGDSSKVSKARDEMVQGVVGLIILVIGYGAVGLIGRVLGLDLINVADTICNVIPNRPC